MNAIASKSEADWCAEDDMRTLMEAEKIKADPKRLKAARAMAKTKVAAMTKIATGGKE